MAHSGSLNISEEKNLIHSTADGVNEFQLLREAWRNAVQASSTVKCANWKLPENPTLAFSNTADSNQMSSVCEEEREGDICKHCGNVSTLLDIFMDTHKGNNGEKADKCDMI